MAKSLSGPGAPVPAPTRRMVPISSLVANPRNDRIHDAEQVEMLKASILKFGQPWPVLVRKSNRMLISGHGVHRAMAELGIVEIDALMWDVNQKIADQYLVADNRLGELSSSDPDRRRSLLAGVEEEDWPALGFQPGDMEDLLGGGGEEIEVREVGTDRVYDRFWISVTGPLEQQAVALKRLQEIMAGLPEVEVELGTVAG